jgi:uncharacterized protein (TIGR01615 family)
VAKCTDYGCVIERLNRAGYMVTMRRVDTRYTSNTFAMVQHYGEDIYIKTEFDQTFNTAYIEFMDLPHLFVGTKDDLLSAVYGVSSKMGRRYAEDKLSLPPWRALSSMLDSWFGAHHTDKRYIVSS